jgi:hypothetical protein
MPKCINCEHCIMDSVWGDCKCRVKQTYVYSLGKDIACEDFKDKEKKDENSSSTQ